MDLKSVVWILLLIWIVGYVNLYFKELNHLSNVESFDDQLDDDNDNIESFSSDIQVCRDNGHTKEFCSSVSHPSECTTPLGQIGKLSKKFRGPDGPMCVVNEEQEDNLIGIGMSSRDPSILMDKDEKPTNRRRLKWRDDTKPIDIETGPRHGHTIYSEGLNQCKLDVDGVKPFNIFIDVWDNQYSSNI